MCVCVSVGFTEHTDRGLARVGLKNQDRTKQEDRGRKAYRQANTIRQSVCVCACVCVCVRAQERMPIVAQRAREWLFPSIITITLESSEYVHDSFSRYPDILSHLTGLQAPALAVLSLAGLNCTAETAQRLVVPLQGLSHLRVKMSCRSMLTDALLSALLHMGGHIKVWTSVLHLWTHTHTHAMRHIHVVQ